jgi:hypothetical protein
MRWILPLWHRSPRLHRQRTGRAVAALQHCQLHVEQLEAINPPGVLSGIVPSYHL